MNQKGVCECKQTCHSCAEHERGFYIGRYDGINKASTLFTF